MKQRRLLLALGLALIQACGGSKGNGGPTSPTPTATRIIRLEGDLAFGNILVGATFDAVLRIHNEGSEALTVTGMTGPGGYTSTWTSGTIAARSSQAATIRFAPTAAQTYNGTLTVQANHTSGTNTIAISGTGALPPRELFTKTGSGNSVFDMPTDVRRVRIFGRWSGAGTSNFIVRVGGTSVVNAILRDRNPYEGTHLVTGGVVQITSSENIVEWRFTEER
jgi:Abnormal spindle-like microcephaly-assoc'd, ASPM-SPD-2-Hydin